MQIHTHQILVIKNQNKYLQYYDKDWNSYLFLNKKPDKIPYIDDIETYINNMFNISDSKCHYLGNILNKKLSIKYNKIREYQHFIYSVDSKQLNNKFTSTEFKLNNIKYKWFTLDELLSDARIQEVNSDIVGEVIKLTSGD